MTVTLSLDHHVLARYGNSDVQILGTLKMKFQINGFLNNPRENIGFHLISGLPSIWKWPNLPYYGNPKNEII